jgi:UDP-N-acetylglucosamine 2-epimerase (non-hydrolysing)
VIAFVYGTTAELIKLAPVHVRLSARGATPLHWCTSQQASELPAAAKHLGMPVPDVMLANGVGGRSLSSMTDAARWLATVSSTSVAHRRVMRAALRADGRPPFVLVHGDTMTTVLGAVLGRALGATVAHVEAGLRSYDLRNPFPEEIDRILAARIARVHYAPGAHEVHNLRKARGSVVPTNGNTVRDSLALVPDDASTTLADLPQRFGLVSLHRMELIHDADRFVATMNQLADHAKREPLVQVVDPVTAEQLRTLGLDRVHDGTTFRRLDKLEYFDFVALLRRSAYVITDSGGLQEECSGLGIPCLVHRMKTERSDGLGTNALLSEFRTDVLAAFLDDHDRYRRERDLHPTSPSDVIVADLTARGAC